jgi:hypothetical protein
VIAVLEASDACGSDEGVHVDRDHAQDEDDQVAGNKLRARSSYINEVARSLNCIPILLGVRV